LRVKAHQLVGLISFLLSNVSKHYPEPHFSSQKPLWRVRKSPKRRQSDHSQTMHHDMTRQTWRFSAVLRGAGQGVEAGCQPAWQLNALPRLGGREGVRCAYKVQLCVYAHLNSILIFQTYAECYVEECRRGQMVPL